tara:strand:- start:364 stop:723 length:360 start_codon:yes stop_codon:yes gene_type:complete
MTDSKKTSPPPTASIVEERTYVDQAGRRIVELVPVKGDLPETMPRFAGKAMVETAHGAREFGPFPIDADTLERAFALFDSTANARLEEWMSQMRRQAIEAAGRGGPANSLLDPRGRPLA